MAGDAEMATRADLERMGFTVVFLWKNESEERSNSFQTNRWREARYWCESQFGPSIGNDKEGVWMAPLNLDRPTTLSPNGFEFYQGYWSHYQAFIFRNPDDAMKFKLSLG